MLPVLGAAGLPRGARLRVRLGDVDEVTLDISGTLLARLDAAPDGTVAAADGEEDDGDEVAGPIAIAVDLAEPDTDGPSASGPAASEPVAP